MPAKVLLACASVGAISKFRDDTIAFMENYRRVHEDDW